MNKIKYAIIGNGYRAMAFLRVGLALPDQFEITSMLFRNQEKAAEFSKAYNLHAVMTIEECIAARPDFAVIALNREVHPEMLMKLMPYGIPILIETPPAMKYEDLITLWNTARQYQARIQVAEQYFLQPLFQAKLKALSQGILGEISNMYISWAHDYHGVSLIRKFLQTGFETALIYGKSYQFPVTVTDSRYGIRTNGDVVNATRSRYTFEFESGKTAFYDFASDVQYRSKIRTRHLNVQGVRGEMDDDTVRCLTSDNQPIRMDFQVTEDINTLSTYSVNLGNQCLYINPMVQARLTDDEIAIASCLMGMKEYIQTGNEFYSFADACQDTYLFTVMMEALRQPNIPIQTTKQPWN